MLGACAADVQCSAHGWNRIRLASPPASVLYLETDAGGSTAHTIGSRHGNQSMPMSMNRPVSAQLARRAHKPPTHRRRSGTHGDAPAAADGAQSKPRSPRVSTRSTTRPASASAVSLDTAVRVAASKDLSRPSSRARTPGGRTLAPVLPESPGDGAGDDARSFARDVAHAIEVAMVDGQGDSVVAATSRGAGDDGSSSGAQPGSRPVYECRVGRRLGGSYCLVDAKLNAAPGARLGSASPQHAGAGTWDVRVHDVVSHKEWRLVLPSQPVRLRWGATLCRASSLMRMPCLPAGHIATGAVVHDSSTARGEASWDVLTEMLKMAINLVTMPP